MFAGNEIRRNWKKSEGWADPCRVTTAVRARITGGDRWPAEPRGTRGPSFRRECFISGGRHVEAVGNDEHRWSSKLFVTVGRHLRCRTGRLISQPSRTQPTGPTSVTTQRFAGLRFQRLGAAGTSFVRIVKSWGRQRRHHDILTLATGYSDFKSQLKTFV